MLQEESSQGLGFLVVLGLLWGWGLCCYDDSSPTYHQSIISDIFERRPVLLEWAETEVEVYATQSDRPYELH
jgi:hypothetical protein